MVRKESNNSWQLIANVRDHIEAGMIRSLLNEAGIPVMEKSKGSGAYMGIYMGISSTGIDLYVPAGQLDEAADLLGQESTNLVDNDETTADYSTKNMVRKRLFASIYLAVMILGLMVVIISRVIGLLTAD